MSNGRHEQLRRPWAYLALMGESIEEAIRAARSEVEVGEARAPGEVEACLRLRHRVYVEERAWEADCGAGIETDRYDRHSRHVLLRVRRCGTPVGTVRLVLPLPGAPGSGFPLQEAVHPAALAPVPLHRAAEVSRFALARERPPLSAGANSLLRLLLVQGVVGVCRENGLDWCVMAMERPLLRLLRASGIHCTEAGPQVEHHGLRQPAYFEVDGMLARMGREHLALRDLVASPLAPLARGSHEAGRRAA